MISDTQAAYIAGLFDGEGSIWVVKQKSNYTLGITMGQKMPGILLYVQRTLGMGRVVKSGKNRTLYRFRLYPQEDQREFINLILPYSLVKRRQLELGLEFLKTNPRSREGIARRKDIYWEMKRLKGVDIG